MSKHTDTVLQEDKVTETETLAATCMSSHTPSVLCPHVNTQSRG